jgi:hypothetical protein
MKTIYFYAPKGSLEQLKLQNNLRWDQISVARKFLSGNFTSWILTTYFQVKKSGLSCELIDYVPEEGILIADRDTLGNKYRYFGKTMLICAQGDREFHPSAYLHIVHNPVRFQDQQNKLWNPYYIPHWPQPGLIPRSQERGSTVKNIAFMGSRSNFAHEFKSDQWIKAIEELDCQWYPIFDPSKWNDYSSVDIIVAVRSFDGRTYPNKPASKLVNAWKAGVPAILTPESGFVDLRKSELDFLIVNSIEEAISAVAKLKNSPELYTSMVNNGLKRAEEFSDEKITKCWLDFFNDHVFPEYANWIKASEASKILLFIKRYSRLKIDRMKNRLFRMINR